MPVSDETLAVDVIHDIGPFHDFLSHDDTYRFMRSQSQPKLIDRRVREEWSANGSIGLHERATAEARRILETHVPTPCYQGPPRRWRPSWPMRSGSWGCDPGAAFA